jgi:hypothetical protein
VTVTSDPDWRPPFNSFFTWYIILHCLIAVAMFGAMTAGGALLVAFGVVELAAIEGRVFEIQFLWTAAGALAGIVLAVIVAWRHGMKFRQGFLGFFAGSFVSWIIRLPLILGSAWVAGSFPYLENLPAVAGLDVAYVFVLAVVIRHKRRNALNRRRFTKLVEPFT